MTNARWAAMALAGCLVGNAHAAQISITGSVVQLEPTYLPTEVSFSMSNGSALCPTGHWLIWKNASTSNNQAVYATLLAAYVSNKQITIYLDDADTTCTGTFIHIHD